jgi:hypothetical protein
MWARVRNQVILTRSPESIQTRTRDVGLLRSDAKMMRPGNAIVNESSSGEDATLMIRCVVQATGTRL